MVKRSIIPSFFQVCVIKDLFVYLPFRLVRKTTLNSFEYDKKDDFSFFNHHLLWKYTTSFYSQPILLKHKKDVASCFHICRLIKKMSTIRQVVNNSFCLSIQLVLKSIHFILLQSKLFMVWLIALILVDASDLR